MPDLHPGGLDRYETPQPQKENGPIGLTRKWETFNRISICLTARNAQTTGIFKLEMFRGDHFYLHKSEALLTGERLKELRDSAPAFRRPGDSIKTKNHPLEKR